jgi:hypothetical protein
MHHVDDRSLAGLSLPPDERRELHNPAVQRGVVDVNTSLDHNFFQIPIRNGVADVEEHGVQDNTFRIVAALETNRHVQSLVAKFKAGHLSQAIQVGYQKACDRIHGSDTTRKRIPIFPKIASIPPSMARALMTSATVMAHDRVKLV